MGVRKIEEPYNTCSYRKIYVYFHGKETIIMIDPLDIKTYE